MGLITLKHAGERLRRVFNQPWRGVMRSIRLWLGEILAVPVNFLIAIPNRFLLMRNGIVALPPALLRERVSGERSASMFINKGRKCSKGIATALRKQGREVSSFRTILDFGCGCGRTLIWLKRAQKNQFYGTDIDSEAIYWCQKNYDGEFKINQALPPLQYSNNTFELIYGISIFTHLDEQFQFRWLDELRRITRPGGLVLLTIHGEHVWRKLDEKLIAQLKHKGILFVVDDYWRDKFPEWYQSTFHLKSYVIENFSRYFKILDYIPRGVNKHQDVVIMEKQ
jgi:SAM-dependent methyltransferase